ncbi:antitoxin [Enterobacter kobei]|nr:antitoxin [Enterobacter kobei]
MKSYITIHSCLIGSGGDFEIDYSSDCIQFEKRDKAIKHGLKKQGSDDFNVGVVDDGKLISLDWMNEVVSSDPEELREIALSIGLND